MEIYVSKANEDSKVTDSNGSCEKQAMLYLY